MRRFGISLLLFALCATNFAKAGDFAFDRAMDETQAWAMLDRFGFGATPDSLRRTVGQTPRQYLSSAISGRSALPADVSDVYARLAPRPLSEMWEAYGQGGKALPPVEEVAARQEVRNLLRQYSNEQIQQRLLVMANGDNPGHEALLAFWLNHFSVFAQKAQNELLVADYIRTLEAAMAEDSFLALLRASFFHPAMQIYLDNRESVAPDSPVARQQAARGRLVGINENLARELLELHTLGVDGGYSQADVQSLARIITGAGVLSAGASERQLPNGAWRLGYFVFDPRRHDFSEKHFLGETFPAGQGSDELERALRLMTENPATAKHVAGKLARRFLADEPPVALVEAMATAFRRSGGRISATLQPLLEAPAFAASLQRPAKFKEPVDYVLSAARAACGDVPITNAALLFNTLRGMGQVPMLRTTPDGYGSQENNWLSPAAMGKRLRFAMALGAGRISFGGSDMAEKFSVCRPDATQLVVLGERLGEHSQQLAGQLGPGERLAFVLASPEFMRR